MTQTISRDLDDINAKVKEASYNLRAERVRLIKLKVKEVLGKDVDVKIGEFNTDAVVNLNLNDLAKTEGIVRNSQFFFLHLKNIRQIATVSYKIVQNHRNLTNFV